MDNPAEVGSGHLDNVRRRRADLHDVLVSLESAIAAPTGAGRVAWAERVAKELGRVDDELDAHVAATEGADGLYAEILVDAPRLAPSVRRLQDEHGELRAALDDTNGRVEVLAGGGDDVAGAREAVLGLLGAFARHRQLGADLVYEAYETDIGGG